jgi:hypothetical protein
LPTRTWSASHFPILAAEASEPGVISRHIPPLQGVQATIAVQPIREYTSRHFDRSGANSGARRRLGPAADAIPIVRRRTGNRKPAILQLYIPGHAVLGRHRPRTPDWVGSQAVIEVGVTFLCGRIDAYLAASASSQVHSPGPSFRSDSRWAYSGNR